MYFISVLVIMYFDNVYCNLWSKGVVHYSINPNDYDPHSQDVIMQTLRSVQNEICLKFFNIPVNYTAEKDQRVLYIHNSDKVKICAPQNYDFNQSVINMPIGYKCINEREISRLVVEMLKSSIRKSDTIINSYDLMKKFQEKELNPERASLLSPHDRNYINAHYFQECGGLTQRSAPSRRQEEDLDAELTQQNRKYYQSKVWPLGVVAYKVKRELRDSAEFARVRAAMRAIEVDTCVMFQETSDDAVLDPRNMISFEDNGADWPQLGFQEGVQTLKLSTIGSCLDGGHTAHPLMMLMRVLGFPMMSNRFDRDNYLRINWKNVQKGEELYLAKAPEAAWLKQLPYDFGSVTHAPASFLCPGCVAVYTVEPIQDHMWHRTMTMGHSTRLSADDVRLVSIVYTEQCQARVLPMPEEGAKVDDVALPIDLPDDPAIMKQDDADLPDDPAIMKQDDVDLTGDQVIKKLDGVRFQRIQDSEGQWHMVDLWIKKSDIRQSKRYKPDTHNLYHLYTRDNPTKSQSIVMGNADLLATTNYNCYRRTIILLHGWMGNVISGVNVALVPAFLAAEDVNVIVVDWSSGGGTINYAVAIRNTVRSGKSVGRFINWLNELTKATPDQYHIVGHSLGGHQAGVAGRNVDGDVAYITALDPALPGWYKHKEKLRRSDSAYTEVIHTNAGTLGYESALGHSDFYPNGGYNMPGCDSQICDHSMAYYYLAESITRGGFTSRRCASHTKAMAGKCNLSGSVCMGGLFPKTGCSGIFHLKTNSRSPYSKG